MRAGQGLGVEHQELSRKNEPWRSCLKKHKQLLDGFALDALRFRLGG